MFSETALESHVIDDPYVEAPAASPRQISPRAPADSPRRSPRGFASRVDSARNRAHERADEKEEDALAHDSHHADQAQVSPRQLTSPHLTPRKKVLHTGQVPQVDAAAVRRGDVSEVQNEAARDPDTRSKGMPAARDVAADKSPYNSAANSPRNLEAVSGAGGVKTDLLKFAVSFDVKFFADSSCVITQV